MYLTQHCQYVIISICYQYKTYWDTLHYFFVLSLWNMVCNLYLQGISIRTGLISSPQQPHTASRYWIGQGSSGRQDQPTFLCGPLPVPAALLTVYTQPFKSPFLPFRAHREPYITWEVLPDDSRPLCCLRLLHTYFSQQAVRTFETSFLLRLQQLFSFFFFHHYLLFYTHGAAPKLDCKILRGEKHLKFSMSLIQYLPCGLQIFGGWYTKCSAQFIIWLRN